jgi:hypothetical protein
MVENKKEKLKAKVSSSVEEVERTVRNNHLNRTIRKNISVKEEYCFIVPWQLH